MNEKCVPQYAIPRLARHFWAVLAFPDRKSFSRRNLLYMRSFAEELPDAEFVQQLVALLPWIQNLLLLTKLKAREERVWYAAKAAGRLAREWAPEGLVGTFF